MTTFRIWLLRYGVVIVSLSSQVLRSSAQVFEPLFEFVGSEPQRWPKPSAVSCAEVQSMKGQNLIITTLAGGQVALCDTDTMGGGWIFVQRRVDLGTPREGNFTRNWEEYKHGFGVINGDFWLGNENIHRLTKNNLLEFEIYFSISYYSEMLWGSFEHFSVGSETDHYKITVGNKTSGNLTNQPLSYHNGCPFSTYDRDNDYYPTNCAEASKGGWWYKDCVQVQFNGGDWSELRWGEQDAKEKATDTFMMIRRKKF